MMGTVFESVLFPALDEKLQARAKRTGIPASCICLKPSDDGTGASLYIHEQKSSGEVLDTEIMRFDSGETGTCTVSVRTLASDAAGPLKGSADAGTDTYGWQSFCCGDLAEDTVKRISLYAADILQYEFDAYETDAEPFECCSRNYTCSIRGECLHPDQMYAKACLFRKTLPNG